MNKPDRMHFSIAMTAMLAFAFAILAPSGSAYARDVDWAALNPNLAGATFVEDSTKCATCHKAYVHTYEGTTHDRALGAGGCESCHGPMSKHLAAPRRQRLETTISFSEGGLAPQQKASICLQCHEGSERTYWQGGAHEASDVSCNSCHYVMERKSDDSLTIKEDASAMCLTCHLEKQGQVLKSSHMPVREGKIDCSDCHNPHGSYGPKLLASATVNETCYQCHEEKRGPFLWEHAPVREDCSNCHEPHGSNNPGMLTNKGSFLCLSCHQYGGHPNMPRYNRVSSTVGQGCVNCHSRVHGSNHPSGSKLTR
jgi:DmsE family decaheme c-type cytochrome